MSPLRALRCTACGESALAPQATRWSPEEVSRDAIACTACGTTFAAVWGTPFIGHYESGDVTGLIEIAANARDERSAADRAAVERLEELLRRYHEAGDKASFAAGCGDEFVRAPWFANRYTEYAAFRALAKEVELSGREVLDVGAGTGFDTWRLVQAGGRVTALEYNPVLVRRGRSVVPEARWIGGLAHVLPFESETFDVVCANAALHHMRDVPAAMREMLRVLRPGGRLLTVGDPFRADRSTDDLELDVFDRHPDVLLGVNESIPTFGRLVEALAERRDDLDVTFLTSELHEARGRTFRRRAARSHREWSFPATNRLARAGGTLSMRVGVRRSLGIAARTQDRIVLHAGEYARVLPDYAAAVSRLVPLLPAPLVDRDFPGERQTKFELLNGWQKPQPGKEYRTGYRRSRWFLTRPGDARALRFRVRRAEAGAAEGVLEASVDGSPGAAAPLVSDWQEISVSLEGVRPGARFVCELGVVVTRPEDAAFDDYRFAVGNRRFA